MSLKSSGFPQSYPICATGPLVGGPRAIRQSIFDDIDEQAAQLVGHEQSYQQLSAGRFRGRFTTAELGGDAWLFIEETNQSLAQHCHVPPGMVSFMFLLGPDQSVRLERDDFGSDDLAVLPGSTHFFVRCPANTILCVITLEEHRLARTIGLATGDGSPGAYILRSRHLKSTVGALRGLVGTFLSMIAGSNNDLDDALAQWHLKEALLSTLALALSTGARADQSLPAPLYDQALALIDGDLSAVSVTGLCNTLEVSRRILEDIFRRQLRIGPARFIKTLRLNAIRRDLRIDCRRPVADVAAEWGIWHPSHLTQSYTEMFDELPSKGRRQRVANAEHIVRGGPIFWQSGPVPDLTTRLSI